MTIWIGRALSALVVLFLLFDAGTAFLAPHSLDGEMAATGFPAGLIGIVGGIALAGAILYAIPRTALIGAILITGFVGGAICTHLRVDGIGSPPEIVCALLGLAAWAGLWLRDARLRALAMKGVAI